MKTKPTVVTLLLLLTLVLTLSANNVAIEAHAQTTIGLLQDFCDDYAPVTLVDEEEYEASDFTTITDFAGNSYYYSTVSPQGYVIMHAATQKVVEASFDDVDPFEQISTTGDRFYAGPGQYFRKVANEEGDLVYRSYIGQEYELNDEILVSMSQTLNTQMSTMPEVDTSTPSVADTLTVSGTTYIRDYQYFEILASVCKNWNPSNTLKDYLYRTVNTEKAIPKNIGGNCGFNCLALVLGYLDTYKNAGVIPAQYTYTVDSTHYTDLNMSYGQISMGNIEYLPVVSQELSTILTRYKYPNYTVPNSWYGCPAYNTDLENSMSEYMQDYMPFGINIQQTLRYSISRCKTDINAGRPVILSLGDYVLENDSGAVLSGLAHCVIAYGYEGDMYAVFDPDLGCKMWLTQCHAGLSYSVDIIAEHTHGSGLVFLNNGCWGAYCPCGYKTCYHTSGLFNSNHGCISCGTVYHTLSYPQEMVYTASGHRMYCLQCNEYVMVEHTLQISPLGGFYCACGYSSSDDGPITLDDPIDNEDI